jgi:uncharacterized protein (TIGR00255 family)
MSCEPDVRRLVQSMVGRGRVEISVSMSPVAGETLNPLAVNIGQAREYAEIARAVADQLGLSGGPTLAWLLEQPGVISRETEPALAHDDVWPLLDDVVRRALGELDLRRTIEGRALAQELTAIHDTFSAHIEDIVKRAPAALERRAARLRERIQSLLGGTPLDETRIATEIAVWAEKTDITEELARLRAHADQFALLLREGGPVGRTLDFLIQEMNREVNTVASKADDLEISQAVIAAKGALEKLREQAQNIE